LPVASSTVGRAGILAIEKPESLLKGADDAQRFADLDLRRGLGLVDDQDLTRGAPRNTSTARQRASATGLEFGALFS